MKLSDTACNVRMYKIHTIVNARRMKLV